MAICFFFVFRIQGRKICQPEEATLRNLGIESASFGFHWAWSVPVYGSSPNIQLFKDEYQTT